MADRKGSDWSPGAIPVYLDRERIVGPTRVAAVPDPEAEAGYRIIVSTDPDDEWFVDECRRARDG